MTINNYYVNVFKKIGCLIGVTVLIALAGCNNSNSNSDSDISSVYSKGNNTVVSENATSKNNPEISEAESSSGESKSEINKYEIDSHESSANVSTSSSISNIDSNIDKNNNIKSETNNSKANRSNTKSVIPKNETVNTPIDKNQSNNSSTDKTVSKTNGNSSKSEEMSNNYSKFNKQIGVYKTKNLPSVSSYYDDMCPAWIGIYSIGKSEKIEKEIVEKFNVSFGYYANESVVCSYIGKYTVEGYKKPKEIYQYTIEDSTYPLLQDELYVITKKICDDGSAWVGFPVPGTLDTMDTSYRVSKLIKKMDKMFCEWTGYSMEFMNSNRDKFLIDMISVAGKVRTKDGQVLDIVYRYTRGVDMPIKN